MLYWKRLTILIDFPDPSDPPDPDMSQADYLADICLWTPGIEWVDCRARSAMYHANKDLVYAGDCFLYLHFTSLFYISHLAIAVYF